MQNKDYYRNKFAKLQVRKDNNVFFYSNNYKQQTRDSQMKGIHLRKLQRGTSSIINDGEVLVHRIMLAHHSCCSIQVTNSLLRQHDQSFRCTTQISNQQRIIGSTYAAASAS